MDLFYSKKKLSDRNDHLGEALDGFGRGCVSVGEALHGIGLLD